MGNMMTDGVMRSRHKIKYKQTKESRKLVEVKIWETSGSYKGHGNLRTACPRFPCHHSYSIKSTAEDVRVRRDMLRSCVGGG